jgi:Tol biopolymer transport system component
VRAAAFQDRVGGLGAIYPVFSADGSRIVHSVRGPANRCGIAERDLATDAERIIAGATESSLSCKAVLDWSFDGLSLLVRDEDVLRILRFDGLGAIGEIARPGRVWEGRFAPDGRSIAYSSDETGRAEIYVQSLPSGIPRRISAGGGRWPAWTHGGTRLVFMAPDGRVQEADPITGGAPRTLFTVQNWRRTTFDDNGTGLGVIGNGERFLVRMSPSGVALAFVSDWVAMMRQEPAAGDGR